MIKEIINEIIIELKKILGKDTIILLESDLIKSPSIAVWITDSDNQVDTYNIIYVNFLVRESKTNYGDYARLVYEALQNIANIEKTEYNVFGITLEQGVKKLNYTQDDKSLESLIISKVFWNNKT